MTSQKGSKKQIIWIMLYCFKNYNLKLCLSQKKNNHEKQKLF